MKRLIPLLLALALLLAACTAPQSTSLPIDEASAPPETSRQPVPQPQIQEPVPVVQLPSEGEAAAYRIAYSYRYFQDNMRAILVGKEDMWLAFDDTLLHYTPGTFATVAKDVYSLAGERDGTLYVIARDDSHTPLFPEKSVYERAAGLYALNPATGKRQLLASGAQQAGLIGDWLVYTMVAPFADDEAQQILSLYAYSLETGESSLLFEDNYAGLWDDILEWFMAFGVSIRGDGRYLGVTLCYPKGSEVPTERLLVYDRQLNLVADSDKEMVDLGDGRSLYQDVYTFSDGFSWPVAWSNSNNFTVSMGTETLEASVEWAGSEYPYTATLTLASSKQPGALFILETTGMDIYGPALYLHNQVLFIDVGDDGLLAYDANNGALVGYLEPGTNIIPQL